MLLLLGGIKGLLGLCAVFAAPLFSMVPHLDAADAGGGGGAADDAGADGAGAAGDDDGAGGAAGDDDGGDPDDEERQAAGGDPDDDDENDEAGLPENVRNDPKWLRTQRRKLQREVAPLRPLKDRLRGPDGRFLTADELDRRFGKARDMEEFESLLSEQPDLVQIILDRKAGKGRPAAAGADEDAFQDPFADDAAVPWDVTTDTGRAFRDLFRNQAKENHALKQSLRRLERSLGDVTTRETTRTLAQHEDHWRAAVRTAATQLPAEARQAFADAVRGVFEVAKRDKTLGRLNVQQVIERYVTPYRKAAKGQQRTNAAGQQRRAEGNRQLPRSGAPGRTSVATANDTNKPGAGTIKDAKKSFYERLGMQAPAR